MREIRRGKPSSAITQLCLQTPMLIQFFRWDGLAVVLGRLQTTEEGRVTLEEWLDFCLGQSMGAAAKALRQRAREESDELCRMVTETSRSLRWSKTEDAVLRELFERVDKDSSGTLDKSELVGP